MIARARAAVFAIALLLAPGISRAQDSERSLHWRSIDVRAHLQADGSLRVLERQAMVFDGDWNGGERVFNVRPGQTLALHTMTRVAADGTRISMQQGDLAAVDQFDWSNQSTLRWRSRLPSDPPFAHHEITYELDYTLTGILVAEGDQYRLDHDFAFPDRDGAIESFALDLQVDAAWQSSVSLPLHLERENLQPGTTVVVTVPLQYIGAGTPSVQRPVPLRVRALLAAFLIVSAAILQRRFIVGEKVRGRFRPLTPVASIDRAWLERHIFSRPPEVVGAVWDNTTSSAEVGAMIARMVLEGKLASRPKSAKRRAALQLELKVDREQLSDDERALVDALFDRNATFTDTERIRKRYEQSGFDPARLVGEGIQRQVSQLIVSGSDPKQGSTFLVWIAIPAAIVSAVGAIGIANGSGASAAPITTIGIGFILLVRAFSYRARVGGTQRRAKQLGIWYWLAAVPALALVLGVFERGAVLSVADTLSPVVNVSLFVYMAALYLAIAFLVLRAARTRENIDRLEIRRELAAAREYFVHELNQEKPQLDDTWFPWLVAFGLGKHVDKWFGAFAGANATVGTGATAAHASGGTWTGGGELFGGGGGFGGGGAGRSWTSSVTELSRGVAAPSSSDSSGGGSSGGGSSGGGGGGGW